MFFEKEKQQKEDIKKSEVVTKIPPVESFMDRRIPYNTQYVIESLLRKLISKEILSVNDAKQIMASGESYLH
jgi:hypothetical protein